VKEEKILTRTHYESYASIALPDQVIAVACVSLIRKRSIWGSRPVSLACRLPVAMVVRTQPTSSPPP